MFEFIHRKQKRIYLDHASATPIAPEALSATMRGYELCGNPGSIHADGVVAKKMLEDSRERIARELGVKAREIIFTSGATEGNNIAILGLAMAQVRHKEGGPVRLVPPLEGTHWIVSSIEHDSVLECFTEIERLGGTVTHLDPDARGIISAEKVAQALRPHTLLVSIGWGNNEIGVVQPLREIAYAIRKGEASLPLSRILLHTDAGQAPLYLAPHIHTLGVDMAVFGSGKLYGPRGIGALYVSNRVELASLSFGGSQERGLRAGTETPALAAGFAEAFALAGKERRAESVRVRKLRDEFAQEVLTRIPNAIINGSTSLTAGGDLKHVLPHMFNISVPNSNAEYMVLALDRAGISISTKSACREGAASSHVVAALAGEAWRAKNTLRFSLGRTTTHAQLTQALCMMVSLLPRSSR